MGRKFNKSNLTKLFKGFRPGIRPKYKLNVKALEKCKVLTSLQHSIVQDALNKCAYTKEIKVGKKKKVINKLIITVSNPYIARLFALLEKPYNDAKIDHLGNPWEKPKEPTKEEMEEMDKKIAKAKGRKGKSRKDIKKENK